jgi:hypothetical protein
LRASADNVVIVTDGYRGLALRGFLRRGFSARSVKNPHGYPTLTAEIKRGSPMEPFMKAIRDKVP